VEQPNPHRSTNTAWRTLTSRLVSTLGASVAIMTTLWGASGCNGSSKPRVVAMPAAHPEGEGRPLHLMPPFELARAEDAVVRITGEVTCTGTLIADNLVLTAHHCVAARDSKGRVLDYNKDPEDVDIELGGDYLPWGEVRVRAVIAPNCGYASGEGDIAILVLSRHLIGIPTAVPRLESEPKLHEELHAIGFGRCALSRDAIHRVARESGPIDAVEPGHIAATASICPGDSGGPVFANGEIVGVISASVMDGDDKTRGLSLFTRVDVWPQIFSAAHEIANGASPSELPPYGECALPSRPRARSH